MAVETYMNRALAEAANIVGRSIEAQTGGTVEPTPTPAPESNSGTTQSPLLFFIALGFGVVFTNLWIIVGVKYCFRYNARNRALAAQGDAEDPINLGNVNTRPRRRRREKKLMTIEETNERFPLMKYSTWVASRAQEGLPREGGVTATPGSRPATLRNAEGAVPASPTETKHSIEFRDRADVTPEENAQPTTTHEAAAPIPTSYEAAAPRPTSYEASAPIPTSYEASAPMPTSYYGATAEARHSLDRDEKPSDGQPHLPTLEEVNTNNTTNTHDPKNPDHPDDDASDDDDHILTALGPDLLDHPGDSCAICLDTLEPTDDVRGLTCGHAFHASCLDPWLTSRRACCPLCKADYFIPKPRPEGADAAAEQGGESRSRRRERVNMPQQPRNAWMGFRGHPRIFTGRFVGTRPPAVREEDPFEHSSERARRERRARRREQAEAEVRAQRVRQGGGGGLARLAGRLNPWGGRQEQRGSVEIVTPAQLEAQVGR